MTPAVCPEQLERCWQACWTRARRPVEGVLITEEEAERIAEQAIRNASFEFESFDDEVAFTARAIEIAGEATRELVAAKRRSDADPQLHHDPEDRRYERNLDLDRLQRYDPDRGFNDREWNGLPDLLKPLALRTLQRKGISGHDAEEVFMDALVELAKVRNSDNKAPILDPTVFEELIPLHLRIVGFRAIDWQRRRTTLKNRPNDGESFDALTDDSERPLQFEDPSADPEAPTFEHIYKECREVLDSDEWDLVYTLFVAQAATIQELIEEQDFCHRYGLKRSASASTRRRVLNERIQTALEKIRKTLVD
ncbi:hypothetical protein [Haloferula sp. A504]|uniref:hypothetical protein n=1 Tax=Haloferula sp. A504 TaxID=3373601 RepID=UPI0031BD6106|nr:hypothetical protein [Verrucomicrobiaceae bacterium E54]